MKEFAIGGTRIQTGSFSDSQTKPFNQQHRLSQHFAEKSGVLFFEVVSEKGELGLRKK